MPRIFGKSAPPAPPSPSLVRSSSGSMHLPAFLLAALPILLLSGLRPALAKGASPRVDTPPGATLLAQIPVAPLGYRAPGALYLLSRESFSSLEFIDSQHLLFTFHESKLLRRDQDASASDDDQVIHAEVLDLPGGNVTASTDWRMHDHSRYLWPLSGGRFLVRQRNLYWITDATLKPGSYIHSGAPVLTTEVSPDGKLMLVEGAYQPSPEEPTKLSLADGDGDAPKMQQAVIAMMDVDSRAVQAELRTPEAILLPVTSSGYLGVREEKENSYRLTFLPFQGQKVVLGDVASTCTPRETFVSADALMIASCGPDTPALYLDAWTIDGKKLWSGRRDGSTAWPTFARAINGSRFAVGLLRVKQPISTPDSLVDEDVEGQMVQVFDTRTGALLLSTDASPVLSAGQNFALSPDGEQLAILRHGAIEVYRIPGAPAPPATPQKK